MPNASQSQTFNKLKVRGKKRLSGLAWRLDAKGQWHQLTTPDSPGIKKQEKKRYFVALLARETYQESWASYPIRSARALRKILDSKRKAREFFFIGHWNNGKRDVLTVRVIEQLKNEVEKAQFLFPETLVLGASVAQGFYHLEADGDAYFIYKKPDGGWQTLVQSKLINSAEKAKLALGCGTEVNEHAWNESQLRAMLATTVFNLPLHFWSQGWQNGQRETQKAFPWQKLVIGLSAVGVAYLLLSSLFLYSYSIWSTEKVDELTPKVSTVLAEQDKLQRAQQQLTTFNANLMTAELLNQFWTIVATANKLEASIDYSSYNGERLTLGGEAKDALQLLRKLHEIPEVSSAEFATPLRNGRGGQTFRIDILLNNSGGKV